MNNKEYKIKEVDLHLTNRCNQNCYYCSFNANNNKLDELNIDQILHLAIDLKRLGCTDIHLTGGEPTLRKDLVQIIEILTSNEFKIRLLTNGTHLSSERLNNLYLSGLRSIMISIDSSIPEINDKLRGKGSFKNACSCIERCLALEMNVRVNAVLSRENILTFPKFVKFFFDMGVKNISSFYFSPIGRGKHHFEKWLPPAEYLTVLEKMQEEILCHISNDPRINLIIEPGYFNWHKKIDFDLNEFGGCGGGCDNVMRIREYLIIRCDGEVFPCSLLLDSEKSLGNCNDLGIERILNDDIAWSLIFKRSKESIVRCLNCTRWDICGGGCLGYSHLFSNRGELAYDSRCKEGNWYPVCPLMKYNITNNCFGGSSDEVM